MKYITIRRYSKFVSAGKKLCLLVIVLVVGLMLMAPVIQGKKSQLELNLVAQPTNATDDQKYQALVVSPRFYLVNIKDEFYKIIARSALEQTKNIVSLDHPSADIKLSRNKDLKLSSISGTWQQFSKVLTVTEGVTINYDGYVARTESAVLSTENDSIDGRDKVYIEGRAGKLQASGFKADCKNNKIYFTGPVKVILYKMKGK